MDKSTLEKYADLIPIIQKIANDAANKNRAESQFIGLTTPDHHHNGVDSASLDPVEAVNGFEALSATFDATKKVGGVVAPGTLGNQTVTQGSINVGYGNLAVGNNSTTHGVFTTYPIPIVYGNGGGADSAFNGGYAPVGTLVYFLNPPNSGLMVKSTADTPGVAGIWRNVITP